MGPWPHGPRSRLLQDEGACPGNTAALKAALPGRRISEVGALPAAATVKIASRVAAQGTVTSAARAGPAGALSTDPAIIDPKRSSRGNQPGAHGVLGRGGLGARFTRLLVPQWRQTSAQNRLSPLEP